MAYVDETPFKPLWQAKMADEVGEPKYEIVRIPDMFVSFLAEAPRVNPNYVWVKPQAEAWFSE